MRTGDVLSERGRSASRLTEQNAKHIISSLSILRVSVVPELNYTALANGASVYDIAQYHIAASHNSESVFSVNYAKLFTWSVTFYHYML